MSNSNLIEVQHLDRTLTLDGRALPILKDLSFCVGAGEWVALTGPSGSGKSTLLGVLAGLDRPTRGQVRVEGVELGALSENQLARLRNAKIGVIFQAFHLIGTLTAQENVEAPLYVGPQWRQAAQRARAMLAEVGLGDRATHRPHQLSGGEQQRVAIARALVGGPRLLLADEPTGNLDSATSRQVLALIKGLRAQLGLTVVMVTHDAQVAAYADRRLHLVDGQLAEAPAMALSPAGALRPAEAA